MEKFDNVNFFHIRICSILTELGHYIIQDKVPCLVEAWTAVPQKVAAEWFCCFLLPQVGKMTLGPSSLGQALV